MKHLAFWSYVIEQRYFTYWTHYFLTEEEIDLSLWDETGSKK
jgi:hypothetical protein